MSISNIVSEEQFREIMGTRLGQHLDRAVTTLEHFGPTLSFDVTNVMLHSIEQGKEDEVLTILEAHWREHLQYQHPAIRGCLEDGLGVSLTKQIFLRICQGTLALTPTATAA